MQLTFITVKLHPLLTIALFGGRGFISTYNICTLKLYIPGVSSRLLLLNVSGSCTGRGCLVASLLFIAAIQSVAAGCLVYESGLVRQQQSLKGW